jgi:sec-independent protein translocase protein TatB
MFDVGFSELVLIAVVGLIVIGPERLPKVARTLGHMFGRLQRYVNEVKADISREMELAELRKLQGEVQSAARDIEQSVTQATQEVEHGARALEAQLNDATASESGPAPTPAAVTPAAEPAGAEPPTEPVASSPDAGSGAASVPLPAPVETPRQSALPGFDRI